MKIGHKIVLFYTCLTFGIAMFIIMVFYVFTSRYIDRVFEANLCEKAYLAAQKHFKADEMNADEYKVIERKYSELLPRASETVMRINGNRKALDDTLNLYLSENEQKEIYNGEPINFSKGVMDGAVLYCPDNQGKFIIIVMAHNKYGYKKRLKLIPPARMATTSLFDAIFDVKKITEIKTSRGLNKLM